MDEIFDFIFGNLFIVIIIIGAIIKLFGSKSKQEDATQKEPPARVSNTSASQQRRPEQPVRERVTRSEQVSEQREHLTIEQHRAKQLEQLQRHHQSSRQEDRPHTGMHVEPTVSIVSKETTEDDVTIDLKDKLTHQGLIDSVIMAEVLGSPRALKPYQNISRARRR